MTGNPRPTMQEQQHREPGPSVRWTIDVDALRAVWPIGKLKAGLGALLPKQLCLGVVFNRVRRRKRDGIGVVGMQIKNDKCLRRHGRRRRS